MLLAIARFELRKRFRMLSTWIYFAVLFACGFLAMIAAGGAFSSVSVGLGADKVHANAPQSLNGLITMFSHVGILVTASVFGQALHQDRENHVESLFFTTPIRKLDYLGGRFLGAVTFSLFLFLAIALGLWLGTRMPFVERQAFGPNQFAAYLWPYVTTVLPNIVFAGALFFLLSAVGRQMMPVYVGSVLLVIGYLMAGSLFSKLEYKTLAAMLDPFGMTATRVLTQYRTVSEQNALLVPLQGVLLANRALWLAVGAGLFAFTAMRFRFAHVSTAERRAGKAPLDVPAPRNAPSVKVEHVGYVRLLVRLTWLALKETVKDVYFGVIVFAGLLFMVVASVQAGSLFGTKTHPVTWQVLEITGGTFALFILILLTFYSGELVWRERDAKLAPITDALPVPSWLPFLSKLFTLFLVPVVLLGVLMLGGIAIQTARGYFHYEVGLYLQTLYGLRLAEYLMLCVLAMTVHVLVNHKYVGHFVMVLYYLWTLFMPKLGLEHNLYKFGSQPEIQYSDMNRFGHFVPDVVWFDAYWALVCVLLVVVGQLLWPRGAEGGARFRLREARRRFTLPLRALAAVSAVAAVATGGWVFYNTNVLNHFRTANDQDRVRADYEKRFKALSKTPQPRVVDVDVSFDIFPRGTPELPVNARGVDPSRPALHAKGTYTVTNPNAVPVTTVYVNLPDFLPYDRLAFGGEPRPTSEEPAFGFYTFTLREPLAPGATSKLEFDLWFRDRGLHNGGGSTEVVENGTFFHSTGLPVIGYDERNELTADGARKKFGLPPKDRMADLDDASARANNYIAHDADWVGFRATVSTTDDQIAIAPGYLEREWTEGGRRHFQYAMDRKILHFFSVLSARYAVKRDTWNGVPLEIYYHPAHAYDLEQMMDGMKDALGYCSTSFGPYQHRQARILEFPRYQTYAQAFPNTIPFSEAVGFIAKVDPTDPKDVDYPYYITAHEIAHQWWAHQVIGADVQGATMLSETLAQYSALMVMKKKFGADRMHRFLRYELEQYLASRSFERKREVPLLRVENQPYIHYQKGSLVMYALQDYAGEEVVNRGLAAFLAKTKDKGPPYPTSRDLLGDLRAAFPPELQTLLTDLVETITLFDNRATAATARELPDHTFEITVDVVARKMRADELGVEHDVELDELVDIGAVDADDNVVFREKRRVKSGTSRHVFVVPRRPAKAGIDPLNVLVDRKADDNTVRVTTP